jgi:O-antigen/teichoic acid export membrane protein
VGGDRRAAPPAALVSAEEPAQEAQRGSFGAGLGLGGLSFVATLVVGLVSSIVIARIYGVRVVGEFALASAPTLAAWSLSNLRQGPALVRVLSTQPARAPAVTGLFAAVFAVSWGLTAVVVALLAGASALVFRGPLDRPDLLAPALVMLAQFLVLVNPSWNLENVFSAFRAGRSLFWIRLVEALVVLGASIVASLFGEDVWALVLATCFGAAVTLAQRIWAVRRWMALRTSRAALRDGFRRVPEILRFGLKLAPGNLAEGISYDAPIWVLGLSLPAAAVGAYSRAWQTTNRLYAFGYRVNEMLLPTLVERAAEGDRDAFDRTLLDTMRYVAFALLLVGAAAGGASEGIMHIFGPGFEAASDALAILLVTPALTVLGWICAQAQYAHDRPWTGTINSIAGMAAKVTGVIVLTASWELTGAAAGFAAGTLLQFGLQSLDVARHLHGPVRRWLPLRQIAGILAAYATAFVVSRAIDQALAEPFGLVAALVAGSGVFVVVHALAGGVLERDRARIAEARARLARAQPADQGTPAGG